MAQDYIFSEKVQKGAAIPLNILNCPLINPPPSPPIGGHEGQRSLRWTKGAMADRELNRDVYSSLIRKFELTIVINDMKSRSKRNYFTLYLIIKSKGGNNGF
jgi:hypothetical protein